MTLTPWLQFGEVPPFGGASIIARKEQTVVPLSPIDT